MSATHLSHPSIHLDYCCSKYSVNCSWKEPVGSFYSVQCWNNSSFYLSKVLWLQVLNLKSITMSFGERFGMCHLCSVKNTILPVIMPQSNIRVYCNGVSTSSYFMYELKRVFRHISRVYFAMLTGLKCSLNDSNCKFCSFEMSLK